MDPLVRALLAAALLGASSPSWAAQAKVRTGSAGGSVSGAVGTINTDLGSGLTLNAPTLLNPLNTPLGALQTAPRIETTPQSVVLPASVIQNTPAPTDAPTQSATQPPGPPDEGGKTAGGGGGGPPFFVQTLVKLGVPSELALRLNAYHNASKGADTSDLPSVLAKSLEQVKPEHTDAKQRVLLITAAALLRLPATAESASLLKEFGASFGFSPAQVKALQDHDDAALQKAFASQDLPWALGWGRRLAFLDQASQALIKGDLNAESLAKLQESRDFALLPAELKQALKLTGGPAKAGDAGVVERAGKTKLEDNAPPAPSKDAQAAQRYIRSVMGKRVPTARETQALLEDFMAERDIEPSSPRGRALRQELLPETVASEKKSLQGVDPRFTDFGDVLLKLSAEWNITPSAIERLIKEKGLTGLLLSSDKEMVEAALDGALRRDRLDRVTSRYPGTEQGDLMRDVVNTMSARSGKSVEEIARDGVFIYTDFAGSVPIRAQVSREPDSKARSMVFYIVMQDGKWKLSGYRQNRSHGRGDAALIDAFKNWLAEGGVPSGDFLN